MKKLVICVAVLGMVWTSSAMAVPVPLVNASFEAPAYHKQVNGFDGDVIDSGTGNPFPDVPGWEDDATATWVRSGVLTPGGDGTGIPSGDYAGFLIDQAAAAENIMWQLTGKTVEADEIYTINLWASGKWTGQNMKLSIFSDDGLGNHTEIAASAPIPVPGDKVWHEYSVDLAVGGVGIGGTLGIAIEHLEQEAGVNHWMSYDEVSLDVIPEPATMMLLGLGSLALLKRRRA